MNKIIISLPLLATLSIASIIMLSPLAYGQSAPSIADLVFEQDAAAQNAEVVPASTTTSDEEDEDNSGGNGDGGDLTATLNGETFARGDPVTIRGTVSEKDGASLFVEIRDPDGIQLGTWSVPINNDLTFIHGFTAGQLRDMDKFGTYQITLTYYPPGLSGEETTDLSFEYVSGTSTPAAPTTGTTTAPPTTEAQPQGVEIILMADGTGAIVDDSSPFLPQNRATFNWTQTGGSPIRFENSTIILER
jgi:hypothetical protein